MDLIDLQVKKHFEQGPYKTRSQPPNLVVVFGRTLSFEPATKSAPMLPRLSFTFWALVDAFVQSSAQVSLESLVEAGARLFCLDKNGEVTTLSGPRGMLCPSDRVSSNERLTFYFLIALSTIFFQVLVILLKAILF